MWRRSVPVFQVQQMSIILHKNGIVGGGSSPAGCQWSSLLVLELRVSCASVTDVSPAAAGTCLKLPGCPQEGGNFKNVCVGIAGAVDQVLLWPAEQCRPSVTILISSGLGGKNPSCAVRAVEDGTGLSLLLWQQWELTCPRCAGPARLLWTSGCAVCGFTADHEEVWLCSTPGTWKLLDSCLRAHPGMISPFTWSPIKFQGLLDSAVSRARGLWLLGCCNICNLWRCLISLISSWTLFMSSHTANWPETSAVKAGSPKNPKFRFHP